MAAERLKPPQQPHQVGLRRLKAVNRRRPVSCFCLLWRSSRALKRQARVAALGPSFRTANLFARPTTANHRDTERRVLIYFLSVLSVSPWFDYRLT